MTRRVSHFVEGFGGAPLVSGATPPDLKGHHAALFDGAADARTRPVRIDGLHTGTQIGHYPQRVGQYVTRPELTSPHQLSVSPDAPLMVRDNGRTFIMDGHHRVLAAHMRGEGEVRAKVYDKQQGRYL